MPAATIERVRRILFVTPTHNVWGGMEQWLHNHTLWLQENTDWDVRVGVAWGARYHDPERYLKAHPHLRPHRIDVRVGTEYARRAELQKAIDDLAPDLVVPILTGSIFPAVAAAKERGSGARFIVPVRSLLPELFVNVADFLPVIDAVVSVNRLFHRYFVERFPSEAERIHYVRHAARAAEVAHVPRGERLRVGYVGRLEQPAKRVLDFIGLARELQRLGTPADLHLFGSGAQEEELRRQLAEIDLPVAFHGYQSQADLYRQVWPRLDVVVLFSESEGTPNVVCEALQHGVVPVASRYPGLTSEAFVTHGVNGFTFAIGDVPAASRFVDELARDAALLRRLSTAAATEAARDVPERMNRDWVRIYENTLAMPQKRGPVAPAPLRPTGRLDRLSPAAAHRIRKSLRRFHRHANASSEWPVTHPADPAATREVLAWLERNETR